MKNYKNTRGSNLVIKKIEREEERERDTYTKSERNTGPHTHTTIYISFVECV